MTRGFRPRPRHPQTNAAGFALILTMIILSVLVIVAVSYLASMSAERGTADAFANKARAEAAARAGADAAMAMLRENISLFPDSVTAWDATQAQSVVTQPDGSTKSVINEGTSLYLRAQPAAATTPTVPDVAGENRPPMNTATVTDGRRNFVLPLISGVPKGQARLVSEKASIFPIFPASDSNPKDKDFEKTSTDLNVRRSATDKQGVIGSPPGWETSSPVPQGPKPARAPWVTIRDDSDPTAPVLSRYAFFMEDESFKVPVSLAGSDAARGDNLVQLGTPAKPLPVTVKNLSLIGPLAALADPAAKADADNITKARASFPAGLFPEPRALAQAPNLPTALADSLRFLASTDSGALNLSRHGSQRLNLNAAVPAATDPANVSVIQHQVKQLVSTLQFHLPNLGQRFYRTGTGTDSATLNANQVTVDTATYGAANSINRPLIYFYKVAANLRDQLDADSIPTVIEATDGGTVRANSKPTLAVPSDNNPNPIWAIGKDSAPFIEECAVRFRGGPQPGNATYQLTVDYYVEVWNMGSRDVSGSDLGPNPFLRIVNPPKWVADDTKSYPPNYPKSFSFPTLLTSNDAAPADASPSDCRESNISRRDYDLDISGVTFKAGVATVLTTDPDYKQVITGAEAQSHVFVCGFTPNPGPGKRIYKGPMPKHANPTLGNPTLIACDSLRLLLDNTHSTTTGSDYETEIVLGNANGYLDSIWGGLPTYNGTPVAPGTAGANSIVLTSAIVSYPLLGGSLRGNGGSGPPSYAPFSSITGDPRGNGEQLVYKLYTGGGASVDFNSRYYNFGAAGHTLGLPNTDYLQPQQTASPWTPWPDWCLVPSTITAADAPAVVADGPLTSIGQLGDVFDPARQPTTFDNPGINAARGGGRTFKLGQRDDRFHADPSGNPSDPANPAAANPADGIPNSNGWASWRLADLFDLTNDLRIPGAVNLNGVPRDGGAALRAALTGFRFQPRTAAPNPDPMVHGDTTLAAATANTDLPTDSAAATGVAPLVTAIATRLKNTNPTGNTPAGPFFERGEFGELNDVNGKPFFGRSFAGSPFLATNAASTALDGVDMNKVTDRGREEVFRRLAEVVCTRGDTFTVYAVGQSLTRPDATGRQRVTATQRLRLTFRLRPKAVDPMTQVVSDFLPGSPPAAPGTYLDFDPTKDTTIAARYAKPHHYDVEIIQTTMVP